ncbi:hypothetical protein [Virgibacillus sp. W0430]|uniref:hypothetical protein n=1 Tax=Virgibacillus sp. W0430 TaxID=3391580 RepID=UPI003F6DFCD8
MLYYKTIPINLYMKNNAPSFSHPYGTDWLGRDMLARTMKGLGLSFFVGVIAATVSSILALLLSMLSALNERIDFIVTWLIDLFLSVPHIVLLLIISFSIGGGIKGIVVALHLRIGLA